MHGKAHHLFWTGIPTQQVCYASRVPVNMATCGSAAAVWPGLSLSHMQPHTTDVEHETPLSRCQKHGYTLDLPLWAIHKGYCAQTDLPHAPFPGGADPDKGKSLNSMGKAPGNLCH